VPCGAGPKLHHFRLCWDCAHYGLNIKGHWRIQVVDVPEGSESIVCPITNLARLDLAGQLEAFVADSRPRVIAISFRRDIDDTLPPEILCL
jgi:hypothetical protein